MQTVILAAGDFPRQGGAAWRLLRSAARVVCCDSAADVYHRRLRRRAAVVVGDFDSCRFAAASARETVRVDEQETNDLAKAIRLCRERGWSDPVVLGACGRREDHTLGNLFRTLEAGLEVVTDAGRFLPLGRRPDGTGRERLALAVRPGTPVSIFAPDPATRMTSRGLEWPLDGFRFDNLYCATLNRAKGRRIVLSSDRPVYVYLAHE